MGALRKFNNTDLTITAWYSSAVHDGTEALQGFACTAHSSRCEATYSTPLAAMGVE